MKHLILILVLVLFPSHLLSAIHETVPVEKLLAMSLDELMDVEVTLATGTPKPLRQAPAVVSVITADDMKRMGAATIEDALETVPGLHVSATYAFLAPLYSIRGIHSTLNQQVLFLRDGLPVSTVYYGTRSPVYRMPVSAISRIEVIRGPGSAIYGADAVAGIINVITKNQNDISGTETGVRYGSFDTSTLWMNHATAFSGWNAIFGIDYQKTNGDNGRIVTRDLQTTLDGVNTLLGFPSASLTPGEINSASERIDGRLTLNKDRWTLNLWTHLTLDSGFYGLTPVLDPWGRAEAKMFEADLTYRNIDIHPDWDLEMRLSYQHINSNSISRLFPPGTILPIATDGNIFSGAVPYAGHALFPDGLFGQPIISDRQPALDLTTLYSGFENHLLRIGAGVRHFELKTENYKNFGPGILDIYPAAAVPPPPIVMLPPQPGALTYLNGDSPYIFINHQYRTIKHLSFQDEWAFSENWELTAGARYDHYSDSGSATNPRLALVWTPRNDLTAKALYGRAFRPPSFAKLYLRNNPSALGNPNLRPETIDTYELALDYHPRPNIQTTLNLFTYRLDDVIDSLPTPGASTISAQNARDQKGYGLEAEIKWQITDTLQLQANYSCQRSENRATGELVANAPDMQLVMTTGIAGGLHIAL